MTQFVPKQTVKQWKLSKSFNMCKCSDHDQSQNLMIDPRRWVKPTTSTGSDSPHQLVRPDSPHQPGQAKPTTPTHEATRMTCIVTDRHDNHAVCSSFCQKSIFLFVDEGQQRFFADHRQRRLWTSSSSCTPGWARRGNSQSTTSVTGRQDRSTSRSFPARFVNIRRRIANFLIR